MPEQTVLVTGGAGYIGSHAVIELIDQNFNVVILDNLSTGFKQLIHPKAIFINGDIGDNKILEKVFTQHKIDCVMNFAGSIVVPESVENPLKYYRNNTINTITLIEKCIEHKVNKFIFSSTAAVYGIPENNPVNEETNVSPINPYGMSKLMIEHVLKDTSYAYPDFKYIALRYFNVAGADLKGRSGQLSPKATHLIKTASQLVTGQRDSMNIFGVDYDTNDGTCVRDYIHVSDLAMAHIDTLKYLEKEKKSNIFNVGYGKGYSVREVLNTTEKIIDKKLNIINSPRRAGDPPALTSNADKIKSKTNWKPKFNDLNLIIKSALDWEEKINKS